MNLHSIIVFLVLSIQAVPVENTAKAAIFSIGGGMRVITVYPAVIIWIIV